MKSKILLTLLLLLPQIFFAQEIYTLEKSIATALEKSFGIKSAEYSLESSQKELEAFRSGLLSNLNFEVDIPSYSKSLTSQFNPQTGKNEFYQVGNSKVEARLSLSQPIIFTNGKINLTGRIFGREQFGSNINNKTRDYFTNFSVSLNHPLFIFNRQKANMERAEINLEKEKRNYSQAERDIIYNVKVSFYNLFKIKESVKITKEKVDKNIESYKTAKNKYNAGLIAEVEALQLEVDLSSSKNQLLDLERSFEESLNQFKLLIGIDMGKNIDIVSDLELDIITIDEEAAINSALTNRTELLNMKDDIYLSEQNVEEVDSRKQIKLDLNASYGVSNNKDKMKYLFDKMLDDINVALTLTIPVWDWGENSQRIQAAEARLSSQKLNYENRQKVIKNEIKEVINRIKSAKSRLDVLSKSVEIAEKSYDISLERFKSGTISSFNLAQIQIRLTEARNNSVAALIDYKLAVADLERKTYLRFE